jgi:hypothetical protein
VESIGGEVDTLEVVRIVVDLLQLAAVAGGEDGSQAFSVSKR